MKTRRSLKLEDNMRTVLFSKTNNDNSIVPESPLSTSTKPIQNAVSMSVIETPEDTFGQYKRRSKIRKSRGKASLDQSDVLELSIIETTPNLNLSKRKDIEEILESDFLHCNSNADHEKANPSTSNLEEDRNKVIEMSCKRKSSEIVLPLKFHDGQSLDKNCGARRRSSRKSQPFKYIRGKCDLTTSSVSICKSLQNESNASNDSLVVQMSVNHSDTPHHRSYDVSDSFAESNFVKNTTTVSFDDSNLDLTPANCNNDILVSQDVPSLSLMNESSDIIKRKQSKNPSDSLHISVNLTNEIPDISVQNSHTPCNKLDKKDQLYDLYTDILNDLKTSEGELSPLNRSIFQSQDSLSPTQPAIILTLQGVVAYVDVRCGAENRSQAFKEVLKSLGAAVPEKFTTNVTHVIFREGSKVTFQKASQRGIHLVSPLWVEACRVKQIRVSEALFPISSEYQNKFSLEHGKAIFPRKLKSMQPRQFEEDILIAEAKLKRKRKILTESENLNHVETPTCSKVLVQDINSPLYGIAHLLTPTRGENSPTNSSVSSQSSAEDCHTPLATRMYNKLFSPLQNILPRSASTKTNTASPLIMNINNKSQTNSSDASQHKVISKSNVANTSGNVENHVRASPSKVADKNISEIGKLDINEKKNNKITKDKPVLVPRRSKRLSIISDICDNSIKSSSSENSKAENTFSQSVNSNSSGVSFRKRRLHTVGAIDPNEELLMPCTPPSPFQKRNADFYDTIKKVHISQRKELEKSIKDKNKDVSILPLPRTLKRLNRSENAESSTRIGKHSDLSPVNESTESSRTRKGRFSLCARKRKSVEEFVPKIRSRRKSSKRNPSFKDSFPCICLTSFHSSNIGSMYAIIKSLGGFETSSKVDEYTTHIVCGAERRTINVLLGISKGCWIVDVSWLYESVELLKWAPEEPFEIFNFCPGAKASRLLRSDMPETFKPSLFDKFGCIFVADNCSPLPQIIRDLLLNCGARLSSTMRSAYLVIASEKIDFEIQQVTPTWLFDSIQYWEVKELEEYLL